MADFSTRRTSKERCCAATIAPAAANSDERAAVSLAAGGVIAAAGTWTCGVREGNAAWMAAEAVANALVASVHELAVFRSPACAEGVFDSKWGSLLGGASGMTSRARQRACIDRVAVPAGGSSGFARALIPIDVCYPGRSLPGHGNPFRPLPPPPEAPSALRKPAWLKVPLPGGPDHGRLKTLTRKLGLHGLRGSALPQYRRVLEGRARDHDPDGAGRRVHARLPVLRGENRQAGGGARSAGAAHVGQAIAALGLRYVVITSVDRDDLPDGGSAHYAECIRQVRLQSPETAIETLTPDYQGSDLATLMSARPDVFAHNVEVVSRLQRRIRDPRCSFERSLETCAARRRSTPICSRSRP